MDVVLATRRRRVGAGATAEARGEQHAEVNIYTLTRSFCQASVTGPPATGRVSATECPADLTPGERVSVRFVMGVMVRVARASA